MANENDLRDPWLVAVWPGMGSVALQAGSYLVEKLGAKPIMELPAADYFDIERVEIKGGLARAGKVPRSTFFGWKNPAAGGRDLLIFVGESQPSGRGYEFCRKLLERAGELGARRIFTFAAMATPMHPSAQPRVFSVANDEQLLQELGAQEGLSLLQEGEISGMNGVLLAAAADRDIEGICLLGELPFFAIGVPNPKASQAVLRIFTGMAGVELDFTEIKAHAKAIERNLVELLDRMNRAAAQARGQEDEDEESGFSLPSFAKEEGAEEEPAAEGGLDAQARRKIEVLFDRARKDRTKALELKHELDRLGVFQEYEDRFLDLFKQGG